MPFLHLDTKSQKVFPMGAAAAALIGLAGREIGGVIIYAQSGSKEQLSVVHPLILPDSKTAVRFVAACQRCGFSLDTFLPVADLKRAFSLWHDGFVGEDRAAATPAPPLAEEDFPL